MPRPRTLNREDICLRYSLGDSPQKIAEDLKASLSSVRSILKNEGAWTPIENVRVRSFDEAIFALLEAGERGNALLAEKVGCSRRTVSYARARWLAKQKGGAS